MLLLTRYLGERIILEYPNGDKVIIEVVTVKYNQVKMGLDAPEHINIVRSELLED